MSLLTIVKELSFRNYEIYFSLPKNKDITYINLISPFVKKVFFIKTMPWVYYGNPGFGKRILNFLYLSYKTKGSHLVPILKFIWIIITERIDFSFTNTIHTFDLGVASLLTNRRHFQYIREPVSSKNEGLVKLKLPNNKFIRQFYNLLHTKIICNSNYTYKSCENHFSKEKLTVVYNPVEPLDFNPCEIDSSDIKIITVANLTSNWKNHKFVILLAHYIKTNHPNKNFSFHFYGSLPKESNLYFDDLNKLIDKLDVRNIITFEGSKSITEIYKNANILIHPSGKETFGRIFIEAMSAGVPVIAINGGAASELISNGQNGFLIYNDDFTNCTQRIFEIISNNQIRSKMVEEGLKFSYKFNPKTIVNNIEQTFY